MAEIRAHIQRAGNDAQGVQDYLDGIDADLNDLRNQTGTQLVTEQVEKPGQPITGKVVDLLRGLKPDVLNQAKDLGYEGADKQEASEWVNAVNKGLDMSFEARMERAKAMGFDVDTHYYRGMDKDVKSFRKSLSDHNVIYLTVDPLYASDPHYGGKHDGGVVYDVFVKGNLFDFRNPNHADKLREIKNPVFRSAANGDFRALGDKSVQRKIIEFGYDGYHAVEPGGESSIAVFEPSNIRSVNAAFDPAKADSPMLLDQSTQTQLGGQDVGITGTSDQTNIIESRDQAEKAERRRQRKINQQNFRDDAAREFGEPVQNPRSTKPGYYQVTRAGAREVGPSHFTLDAAGKSSGTADSALGVWAASKESSAAAYGDVLRDYIFHYKKPLAINADVWEEVKPDTVEEAIEFRNGLLEDGYDGLIITGHSQYNHHVALKPESVVKVSEKRMSESFVDMSAIPLMQVEEVGDLTVTNTEMGKKYSGENGSITVLEGAKFAPRQNSIVDFVVDEDQRGKGYGKKILADVLRNYDPATISATASSESSVALFYNSGFRPISNPIATLEKSLQIMREDSSVTMVVPENEPLILNQDQEKNLFVAHNISAEGILAAADLGGLASPSLAVARSDLSKFEGFGEVTLLANPSILQSSKARTFDADVYTPRQKRATYDINRKKYNAFIDETKSNLDGLSLSLPDIDSIEDSSGPDYFIRSDAVKYAWLKSQDKAPKIKQKKVEPVIKKALSLGDGDLTENPKFVKLATEHYSNIVKEMNAVDARRGERYNDLYFNADGDIHFSVLDKLASEVLSFKRSSIDVGQMRHDISVKFRDKKLTDQFENYAKDKFNSLVDGKVLFKGYTSSGKAKYEPYTMENVLKDMTAKLQAGESTFYGAGSIRSAYANEMKTLDDIKKNRNKILSEPDFEKIKEESSKVLDDALTKLKPFYKFDADSYGYFQDAGSAIMEGKKGISEAFKLTSESKKIIDDLVDYLTNLPTSYFEAKVQRAVGFDEFDTAIVPNNINEKALKVLTDAGLQIKKYNPKVEGARSAIIAKQKQLLFQESGGGPQGQIAILPEGAVIKLFESANLSTFLHESAHLFLHMTGKLYSHPKATPEIKADGDAILSFLGAESFESLTVEQHEKWARGMERYFGEGKAPSLELQGPFRRFTQWIKQIYRSLTNLNVELTDDIRKVMDRMLASDEQIDRLAGNFRPLFKDAKDAGMTPAEFKAYEGNAAPEAAKEELFKKLVKDLRRQEEKWWKDEKSIIQEQIAEELKKLPVYSAEQYLRDNNVKISLPQIKAVIPGKLPKRLYGLNSEDGKNADELAAMFGFASGEEMINELANSKTLKQYSAELAEAEMVAKHGDTLNDGSIEEQAQLAMRNDSRAKKLLAELRSLAKKTGKQAIDRESMREYARTTIAKMKIRSINPAKYRAAEIRSAREAAAAKAKGDIDAAHKAKTQEIINFYLGKEAALAKDKAEKIRSSHKAIQSREYDSKKYNNEPYINKAKLLIRVFDYRKLSKKDEVAAKAELETARLWIESQQVGDPEKASPYLVQAEILNRLIPYKEMTVEDLQGLDDTVQSLIKAARETSEAANKIFQDEMDSLAGSIVKNRLKTYQTEVDNDTPYVKLAGHIKESAAALRKMDSLVRQADGMNEQGSLWKKIIKPLLDASSVALEMRGKAGNDFKKIFAGYEGVFGSPLGIDVVREGLTRTKESSDGVAKTLSEIALKALGDGNKITFVFESGKVQRLSYGGRIAFALNLGNDGNYQALTSMDGFPVTDNDINQILSTLTDRDLDLIQSIWDYIDTYWPAAAELEKSRSGAAPIKVQPRSFMAPSGRVMKGGYFPLKGDPANDVHLGDIDVQAAKFNAGGSVSKATKTGSLIERTNFGGKKIDFSIDVVFNHVDEVIHDISHWRAVHDVNRVLQNKKVKSELIKSLGSAGVQAINQRLKEVAAGPNRLEGVKGLERSFRYARLGVTYSALGYNVGSALKQFAGLSTAVPEVGSVNLMNGIVDSWGSWTKTSNLIKSKSPYMKERGQVININIAQARARIRSNSKFDKFLDYSFSFIATADKFVTRPIWMAAYNKGKTIFDTDQECIDYADQIVRRTQSSGDVMDLSNVETKNELMKALTMMYGPMNAIYNVAVEQHLRHKARKIGSTGSITTPQLVSNMLWYSLWPALFMVIFGISDEDEPEDILLKIAGETGSQVFGMFPIARHIYSYIRYGKTFPIPIVDIGSAPFEVAAALDEDKSKKAALAAITGLAPLFQIPGGTQINKSGKYIIDMMDNEVDSFSPWELIVTGKE